jgi:hypothetical protein
MISGGLGMVEAEGRAGGESIREVEPRPGSSGNGRTLARDGVAHLATSRRPLETAADATEARDVIADDVLSVILDSAESTAGGLARPGAPAGRQESDEGNDGHAGRQQAGAAEDWRAKY